MFCCIEHTNVCAQMWTHICIHTCIYPRKKMYIDLVVFICVFIWLWRTCNSYCIFVIQHKWNPAQDAWTLKHNARISHDAGWGVEGNGLCAHQELPSVADDPPDSRACARMRARVGVHGHMWYGLHYNVSWGDPQAVVFVISTENI